jgi:small-conductance mechanosensitive channel
VLNHPVLICLLKSFGDSAVDLEPRFWIHDPMSGVSNVKSEVLLHIWDRFHEHGIDYPHLRRDLHVRGPVGVRVQGADGARGSGATRPW